MTQPLAISYLRFSDPSQASGDSRRRQATAAATYAAEHGLILDETLHDEGVSAFRGKHRERQDPAARGRRREEGALASFLRKVENGEVPKGSYLLIDSFDRLTREKVTWALHLLTGIMARGIIVVTMNDRRRYEGASAGLQELMFALMELSRSNAESEEKSRKVRGALLRRREDARREGKPWAQRWPFWLDQVDDGFVVLEDRADVVRLIFTLKTEGMGNTAIARRLNQAGTQPPRQPGWRRADVQAVLDRKPSHAQVAPEAVSMIQELNTLDVEPIIIAKRLNKEGIEPPRSPTWHSATVAKLLESRSVFGEFQPHRFAEDSRERIPEGDALPDYYPAIVDRATFEKARAVIESRASSPARPQASEFRNLLVGLVRCGKCGGTAGYWKAGKDQRIRCNARNDGGCDNRTRIHYPRLEAELLAYVGGLPIVERTSTVAEDLIAKRAERADVARKIARLYDMAEGDEDPDPDLLERLRSRRAERDALDATIERLEKNERADLAAPSPSDWRAVMGRLIKDLEKADETERYALRAQINARLGQAVTGGFTLDDGHITARFSTTDPTVRGRPRKPLYVGAPNGLIQWELGAEAPDFDQMQRGQKS